MNQNTIHLRFYAFTLTSLKFLFCHFRFSLIVIIICCLLALGAVDDEEDPCHRVNAYKDNGVQAIGEISDRIILITDNWYVFEVPQTALRPDLGKFYLNSGGKPMKVSEKWPELWKDSQFTKIRTESKLAVSYVDSSHGQHDIRFETMLETTDTEGVNFNVETRSVETGAVIAYNQYPYTCMGSGGGDTEWSYCFSKRPDGVIEITAWEWLGEKNQWWHRIYGGFPLCMSPNSPDQIYTHQETDSTCGSDKNVDWPQAYHGFVRNEDDGKAKFYLFAESYVLIFDETVFDIACAESGETCNGPSTSYRKINYEDFIQCDGQVASVISRNLSKSKGLSWPIWLSIILAILLLLLCCLLCIAREAIARQRKSKKHKGKSDSAQNRAGILSLRNPSNNEEKSGGAASFTPKSVRDAISSRFGMLTKRGGPSARKSQKTVRTSNGLGHRMLTKRKSRKPGHRSRSNKGQKPLTARTGLVAGTNERLSRKSHPKKRSKSGDSGHLGRSVRSSPKSKSFSKLSKNCEKSRKRREADPTKRSAIK